MSTLTETIKKVDPYLAPLQSSLNNIFLKVGSYLNQYQSIIGIDIGTTAVKCVAFVEVEGEWTLAKTSLVELEVQKTREKRTEALPAALKKALNGMNIKKAKIVCVLSSPETFLRTLIVPQMPRAELAEAIRWELKNLIHFPVEEASLDFEILGEMADRGVKKWNVNVVCCPRKVIDDLINIFSSLEIKLAAIIPLSSALRNLVEQLNFPSDQPVAVIEMGASLTELNIFQNSHLVFSRKLPVTGFELTQAMTSALVSDQGIIDLTFAEAENIKRMVGMPLGQEFKLIEGKISASQILALIRPKLEQLVEEIERSFSFYREEIHGGKVEKIILFGGGSELKGLDPFLERELGLEVKLGNAFENVKTLDNMAKNQQASFSRFNLSLGAALGMRKGGINLLPVEIKEEKKRLVKKVSLKAFITAIITSSLLFYIGLNIQLEMYAKKLSASQGEFTVLSVEINQLREKIAMDQVFQKELFWDDILKELSNVVPANVYLTYIGLESADSVYLKGMITKNSEAVEMTLSSFMLDLEGGLFKNVALVNTQKMSEGVNTSQFELKMSLDSP